MKKNFIFPVLLLLVLLILSGCYRNRQVQSYQIGLKLNDGVSVTEVVGPGLYSNGDWWGDMVVLNASNITTQWNDPSLVTRDKQPIGLTMAISFSRKRDSESARGLYNNYHTEALDDTALTVLVLSHVPSVAKTITTKYTLDQMLGIAEGAQAVGREVTAQEVFTLLKAETDKLGVELTSVQISDIAVSDDFNAALNAKAQAQINMEVAQQQTKLITEQLQQEKATTQIELEKANRENLVNEQKAKAYEQSPQLLQLRMMELTAEILDDGDTVIYVPEGSNITSVLTGNAPIVPTGN